MSTFEKNINGFKVNMEYLKNHLPDNRADILKALEDKYYVIPKAAFHGDPAYQADNNHHKYSYDDYEQYVTERASICLEIRNNERSIEQIERVLNQNTEFGEYIESFKILVTDNNGVYIPVDRKTMTGFNDNQELMKARKDILRFENEKLNIKLAELKENNKEIRMEFEEKS